MKVTIRPESQSDYECVTQVISKAFKNVPESDHNEEYLVERLRMTSNYIPDLALVAEYKNQVIGFILLIKISIITDNEIFEALAMAPVCVLPKYQNKGIGGQLIKEAHIRALKKGFNSIVLIGHEDYYPRFGYKQMSEFNLKTTFNIPPQYCMAIELIPNSLSNISGTVAYPKAFFE
ncbi:GNAT family N-acetyltransferase [Marinigracilibium pacificum]|uniref:N-acetyltransferase n=1 Tax=Marinigracilibium pacificum TaxID=2729599 RepID=A0A848IZA0_9BACT|nr:N-acetyltransferase [Marinigracilibium pacificum]NMM47544.1 N-acetyltransferase [Marinigracilibium pacificum]